MNNIADNLAEIESKINQAKENANRTNDHITLLAVSKTKPTSDILSAYQTGQRHFGENYVQEAVDKVEQLSHLTDICWHFIGPIQSNKTRLIAHNFSWVHSLDREKIANRLNEQRNGQHTPLNVCLQVNISGEASKSGVSVEELDKLAEFVQQCEHLTLRGLMAIPEKGISIDDNNSNFAKMNTLFKQLKSKYPQVDTLSMGMSNDLNAAISAGSTMVRIGTAIFGSRN